MKRFGFFLFFLLAFLSAFFGAIRVIGGELGFTKTINSQGTGTTITSNRKITPKYDKNSDDKLDFRLTFVAILTTIFAVFFVYSGFKIDGTVQKIEESQKRIYKLEDEVKDDIEFSNQLRYGISFLFSKQYAKAIDALIILKSEPFVIKNSDRKNTCYFLLAHSYYEKGCQDNNIEDVAKGVEFINLAIEDVNHPMRQEIIHKFEEMEKKEKSKQKKKKSKQKKKK